MSTVPTPPPTPVVPVEERERPGRPGEEIVRFEGVHKAFGSNVVYQGLDLSVRRGETLTIIGGSGVGKSVMLKLLIGLIPVDSGSILAFDEDISAMSEGELIRVRSRIAMLFQGAALFDSLSVEDNIKYPLIEHGWGDEDAMDRRVSEVLDMVDLPGVQRKKPSELSGGMRKRVGLARSIAIEPEVILYDEPTTGLDPINVRRINTLILSLQQKLSVTSIVVTHDMDTVFTVTDRLAMVYDKRIAFVGTPDEARGSELRYLSEFVKGGRGLLEEDL